MLVAMMVVGVAAGDTRLVHLAGVAEGIGHVDDSGACGKLVRLGLGQVRHGLHGNGNENAKQGNTNKFMTRPLQPEAACT